MSESEEIFDAGNTTDAKSAQIDAVDLISGNRTLTITKMTNKGGRDQPWDIHYGDEDGKTYKPSLGMRRVITACWGKKFAPIGRKIVVCYESSVVYAGKAVGGIEICAISDITETKTITIPTSRGKFKPITVTPLVPPKLNELSDDALIAITTAFDGCESMADIQGIVKRVKAGRYDESGMELIDGVRASAVDRIQQA